MGGRLRNALLGVLMGMALAVSPALSAEPLHVGISFGGELGGAVVKAFMSRYPGIEVTLETVPSEKLNDILKPRRGQAGTAFDVLWLDSPMECYRLKAAGLLYRYISPYVRELVNPLQDYDGSFTAARFGVVGIVQRGEPRPKTPARWGALPENDQLIVALADPAVSDKAYLIAAHLREAFSRNFFRELFKHGGRLFKTTGEALAATAAGTADVAFAVDLDVVRARGEASPLVIGYPKELILIPAPVAILDGTPQLSVARKFVDFILSPEGQALVAEYGSLPASPNVTVPERFGLPGLKEMKDRVIESNYARLFASKQRVINEVAEAVRAGGKTPRESSRAAATR